MILKRTSSSIYKIIDTIDNYYIIQLLGWVIFQLYFKKTIDILLSNNGHKILPVNYGPISLTLTPVKVVEIVLKSGWSIF